MEKNPEHRLRFTKIRDVKSPTRANKGDAGIDFYVPHHLPILEMLDKNPTLKESNFVSDSLIVYPRERILIPSGIKVLLEPINSMLQANNKSGVCTKTGLIFGAEVIDSPYTGEIHISMINTSKHPIFIKSGDKLVQFIHVPIYLDELEEIPNDLYNQMAENWGTRGDGAFGSSDEKEARDLLAYKKQKLSELENELNLRSF